MKVPMSWFADYTDISQITPKEYAQAVTMTGSKVEGIENIGKDIDNVVTGKILSIREHEDSDHMVVCMVDVSDETIQIVTGAPNVKVGQIVPVAKHMSTLPGGVQIKKGKLRGVESCGMLCSHEELGLTVSDLGYEPEYGILVLPENTPVGMDIKEYFGLNEEVVEYEITSNRPDCFSVIGLARETAATFKKPFSLHVPEYKENSENINDFLSVEVLNPQKCTRYCAKMVKNVKIGPSPKWLVSRLRACGVRSINNIVDITNYIMLEYGQPMHAFDLRDLEGGKIIVRDAKDGEIIKTLDEQERKLTADDLVIADGKKAVAVAGVMGGFNSEVKPDTTTVIFESATFEASSVRLTAQRIGLRTESSSRFEKGLDYNNALLALNRACELVSLLGCGEIVGDTIDLIGKTKEQTVHNFRPEKINEFLGTNITKEEMAEYLRAIEFEVDLEKMTVIAPTFRPDIEAEADIAEEIARFYGYNNIPVTLLNGEATTGGRTPLQYARDKISSLLTAHGMYEIRTYTFTSPTIYDKLLIPCDSVLRNNVVITNPLGEDTSVMRTTTIASMMNALSYNYNHQNSYAKLFEIGKIYLPTKKGKLPDEPEIVTVGMYGDVDFFDLKGIVEDIFEGMNIKDVRFEAQTQNPTYHPGRCANVIINGKNAGVIGQIHPQVTKNFGIDAECYVAEINLLDMFNAIEKEIKFKHLPKFPAVTRDIAMLVDKSTPVGDIEAVISKASGQLLDTINLFDVYEGAQIPEGKKSVAFKISFRAPDRSLTNEEINKVFNKILKDLEYKLQAQLR